MDQRRCRAAGEPEGRKPGRRLGSSAGVQLIEFGLVLPILLLLVVGAWDFGKAFLLKDKLANAAREGARITVSTPLMNDDNCSSSTPCSMVAAEDAVEQYLADASVSGASCITSGSPTNSGLSYTWSCKSGAQLVINRGVLLTVGGVLYQATRVTLTWPVSWGLASFLPKTRFPATVTTTITMQNLS